MANDKQKGGKPSTAKVEADAPEAEEVSADAPAPDDSKYTVAEHLRYAQGMYGEPSHVVAGALAVLAEHDEARDEYTKIDVAGAIMRFRDRAITEEH